MSSEADRKKAGDEEARALEQEYKETHPNGPYPPVESRRIGSHPSTAE
ncbi:MAG: hypothetical protein JRN06_01550 [Nitrososphaerota archaeon]|nr:hypothetical protein [Nitrososphaerota archaeon]MDG7023462.1 hypothetical protein [Nitrososphaerota archaeon]